MNFQNKTYTIRVFLFIRTTFSVAGNFLPSFFHYYFTLIQNHLIQKKDGRDVTGICYNEVECLLKGGILLGYCSGGPPVLKGVCCVFFINAKNCDNSKVEN